MRIPDEELLLPYARGNSVSPNDNSGAFASIAALASPRNEEVLPPDAVRQAPQTITANPNDIPSLMIHEGFEPNEYLDTRGVPTIAFGTNVKKGLTKREQDLLRQAGENADIKKGITPEGGKLLLQSRLIDTVRGLAKNYDWFHEAPPAIQAALANVAYTTGVEGIGGFTNMLSAMGNGDYNAAADELLDSKWTEQVGPTRSKQLAQAIRTGNFDDPNMQNFVSKALNEDNFTPSLDWSEQATKPAFETVLQADTKDFPSYANPNANIEAPRPNLLNSVAQEGGVNLNGQSRYSPEKIVDLIPESGSSSNPISTALKGVLSGDHPSALPYITNGGVRDNTALAPREGEEWLYPSDATNRPALENTLTTPPQGAPSQSTLKAQGAPPEAVEQTAPKTAPKTALDRLLAQSTTAQQDLELSREKLANFDPIEHLKESKGNNRQLRSARISHLGAVLGTIFSDKTSSAGANANLTSSSARLGQIESDISTASTNTAAGLRENVRLNENRVSALRQEKNAEARTLVDQNKQNVSNTNQYQREIESLQRELQKMPKQIIADESQAIRAIETSYKANITANSLHVPMENLMKGKGVSLGYGVSNLQKLERTIDFLTENPLYKRDAKGNQRKTAAGYPILSDIYAEQIKGMSQEESDTYIDNLKDYMRKVAGVGSPSQISPRIERDHAQRAQKAKAAIAEYKKRIKELGANSKQTNAMLARLR